MCDHIEQTNVSKKASYFTNNDVCTNRNEFTQKKDERNIINRYVLKPKQNCFIHQHDDKKIVYICP